MNKKYINPKTGKKYMYYTPQGKGILDVLVWGKIYANRKEKILKQEDTWLGFWVSTVWLGLDHSFLPNQDPLIFETMVFRKGYWSDLDCQRYTTKEEAIRGHKALMRKWSNPFWVSYELIDQKTYGLQYKIKRLLRIKQK